MKIRIGNGFDAHRFTAGSKLVLGGVHVPYDMGMEAHSDGDVVIHALCDAILGALALGDIGQHFPDNDAQFKNVDSRILLKQVVGLMCEHQFKIGNVDLTIIAQAPRLAGYIPAMRQILAQDLQTEMSNVSVKATTTEKMGFTGRGEGIAVMASVILLH